MSKLARVVRVVTVPPVMAAVFLICMVSFSEYITTTETLFALLFLSVFPLLAYPLQPLVPGFRGKGREGQRNLAIVMSVIGYVGGIVYAAISESGFYVWLIFLTYLLSGIGVVVFNKLIKIRASGHACSIIGPLAMLFYVLGPIAAVGLLVPAIVYWSSVKIKRHTVSELAWGSLIPIASLGISYFVCAFTLL